MRWAQIVIRTIAATIAALPPTLFFFMGPRYNALPFRVATVIACLASVMLFVVAFWPAPGAASALRTDAAT